MNHIGERLGLFSNESILFLILGSGLIGMGNSKADNHFFNLEALVKLLGFKGVMITFLIVGTI